MSNGARMSDDGVKRSMSDQLITAERTAFFERWRLHVEPQEADRKAWVRYAVEYGQMGIRSAFLLNGGALIAVPTFAEIFTRGLCARGETLPLIMMGLFVTGLVPAAAATALAFFAMNFFQYESTALRNRMAQLVNYDHQVALGRQPQESRADLEKPGKQEADFSSKAGWFEGLAILSALLSLGTFSVGAGIAVYIVSGSPPS